MNKTAITITTINIPKFLEGLCENINEHSHVDETTIIIIADKKTPNDAEVNTLSQVPRLCASPLAPVPVVPIIATRPA